MNNDDFDFNLDGGGGFGDDPQFDMSQYMSQQANTNFQPASTLQQNQFFSSVQSPNLEAPLDNTSDPNFQNQGGPNVNSNSGITSPFFSDSSSFRPIFQNNFTPSQNTGQNYSHAERRNSSTIQQTIYRKAKWTPDEDNLLKMLVKKEGTNNWSLIAQSINGRTGKQCRERWLNQLRPELTKNNWTPQEDAILIHQQQIHGNMWTKIAQYLPGRSPNNVKNRWSWISRHHTAASLFAQMIPSNFSAGQNPNQNQQQIDNDEVTSPLHSHSHSTSMSPNSMGFNIEQQHLMPPMIGMLQTAPPELQWGTGHYNNGMNRFSSSQNELALNNMRRLAFSDPNDPLHGSAPLSAMSTTSSFNEPVSFNENENEIQMGNNFTPNFISSNNSMNNISNINNNLNSNINNGMNANMNNNINMMNMSNMSGSFGAPMGNGLNNNFNMNMNPNMNMNNNFNNSMPNQNQFINNNNPMNMNINSNMNQNMSVNQNINVNQNDVKPVNNPSNVNNLNSGNTEINDNEAFENNEDFEFDFNTIAGNTETGTDEFNPFDFQWK
ncbi:hypothetical protein TRFO_41821 [Tritrichomonas foetus]|uniref:Myb-like DNA-binding domain containing protein n=1 Tax=Tritrichomonas foetus TaxID=1144522 RepID=A0A1J4KZ09_9EUKA|nr:hypothetical protein TRFO_41821 [Tritrichomonas foetus]|eukprot:OHT16487.1 hypothetical protein TRFO_41821 [Tritrichomonas foetus]